MRLTTLFEEFPSRDWDTDPDGTVRIAVVGLGGYGRNVSLPAIAAGDYADVGAVVSGDSGKAEEVAAEYDAVGMSYEAYERGRHRDAYDAVYVSTPNRLHMDHVVTAAEQGKHVVTEKPVEATTERAEHAVEACADAGVTLMTAYRMQVDPAMRRLREFLREGGIGEVRGLTSDFTFPILAGSRGPDQWRMDAELAGGGAMVDVGVYPLNTSRFLLEADPVAVSATAHGEAPFGEATADPDCPRFVDEDVAFRVEFPDGVVGQFSASFSGHANRTLELRGSEGRVRVDDAYGVNAAREIRVERADGAVETTLGADETCEEFDYFAHCVLTGATPEPDGVDGLVDMRAIDAVYESAATGERVTLE